MERTYSQHTACLSSLESEIWLENIRDELGLHSLLSRIGLSRVSV